VTPAQALAVAPPKDERPRPAAASTLVGLTHLRALAITLVFFCHYSMFPHPAWIRRIGAFGWTGVDLFFVLSGFLISRQLFRAVAATGTFSLRQFYWKRLLRIVPAYVVVVAVYFALPWIHEREALPPLWRFATFTQNLGLDVSVSGTFSHAWSLCIEEQFYLALPLVLLALVAHGRWRRAALWLLPALALAGVGVRAWCYARRVAPLEGSDDFVVGWYRWIYYPTWARLDGLLVGIGIAALFELRPTTRAALARRGPALLLLGAALWAVAYWRFRDATSWTGTLVAFPLISAAYGALVLGALAPTTFLARVTSRVTSFLATLSYALYLVHKACIHVAQAWLGALGLAPNGNAMFAACVAASLAGALVLHLAVERPFLRWRDRVLARRSSATGARLDPLAHPS
jgi:peptidoglycan/LPS O-acetylase OafA/YrhL